MDEYEPIEEGLDKVVDTRSVSVIEIKLSKASTAVSLWPALTAQASQDALDTLDKARGNTSARHCQLSEQHHTLGFARATNRLWTSPS